MILFLILNRKKRGYLPQDRGADMAREAHVARGTCADATRHARPRGRAAWVHADARGGTTWHEGRLAYEGPWVSGS